MLVPYPHHADRHQVRNAEVVERAGAGIKVENREAISVLPGLVRSLMADESRLQRMGEFSLRMGKPRAAEAVAEEVLKLLSCDLTPGPSP